MLFSGCSSETGLRVAGPESTGELAAAPSDALRVGWSAAAAAALVLRLPSPHPGQSRAPHLEDGAQLQTIRRDLQETARRVRAPLATAVHDDVGKWDAS